jgi:hypothetical protein
MSRDLLLLALSVALLPVLYVSIFLHEVGHVVCGWAAGYRVTSFGMGLGRPLRLLRLGHCRVYFCLHRPLQGITFTVSPVLLPRRRRAVWMLSGGVLANLLAAFVSLATGQYFLQARPLWLLAAGANAFLVVYSLIPFSLAVGGSRSYTDGALIMHTLRYGRLPGFAKDVVQTVHALRAHWQAVGDGLVLQLNLTAAAASWLLLGDTERAGQLLDEATAVPGEVPAAFRVHLMMSRGLALSARDPVAALAALTEAEELLGNTGQTGSLFLVRGVRAHVLLKHGDARGASQVLAGLGNHPVSVAGGYWQVSLLATHVQVACALAESTGVESLVTQFEAAPKAVRSDLDQLEMYQALAGWRRRRGDVAGAVSAYEKAVTSAATLHRALAWLPEAQDAFQQRQAPLLTAAEDCVRAAGRDKDAEQLGGLFLRAEEAAKLERERRRKTNARLLRWGSALLLLDGVVGTMAGYWFFAGPRPVNAGFRVYLLVALVAAMATFVVPGTMAVMLLLLGRLFITSWRSSGGLVILILGICPWLLWPVFLLLFLLATKF